MSLTKDQIKAAVMELDLQQREELVNELLLTIPDADRDEIDAAWLAESHARLARFQSSGSTGSPVDDVLARIKSKARP